MLIIFYKGVKMALLSGIQSAAKGASVSVTLSVSDLLSLSSVAADPFFSNQANIEKVSVVYVSASGQQKVTLVFNVATNQLSDTLTFSSHARDQFDLHKVIIYDFDGGFLDVPASDIPSDLGINLASNSGGGAPTPYLQNVAMSSNTIILGKNIIISGSVVNPDGSPINVILTNSIDSNTLYANTTNVNPDGSFSLNIHEAYTSQLVRSNIYDLKVSLVSNPSISTTIQATAEAPAPMLMTFNVTHESPMPIEIMLRAGPNFIVDWGDGNVTHYDYPPYISHTYAAPGVYNVSISGTAREEYIFNGGLGGTPYLTEVSSFGGIGFVDMHGAFYGCQNLTTLPSELPKSATDLSNMLVYCNSLNSDISNWDTSNVTDMHGMFSQMYSFNQDISKWNTSKVTNMDRMFLYASSFDQDLSHWDVTNIASEPSDFATGSALTEAHKPVWGTNGGN